MTEIVPSRDVLIIGAGPAGMSAALWCSDLGLSAVVFEKGSETGGQLLRIYNPVTNYLGVESANGRELRDHFLRTLEKANPQIYLSSESIEIDPDSMSVTATAGKRLTGRAIILATGVRRRRLDVPGEEMFEGMGVIESGSNEKEKTRGKTVVIAGGGDAALENALILAEFASEIYVVHRRSHFRARPEFVEKAKKNPKIKFRLDTVVSCIGGRDRVEEVELTDTRTGAAETIAAEIVLARIGVQPNTELLQGIVDLDSKDYVLINSSCETSAPGIYAVGDVAHPVSPTIVTAAGMGAAAAKAIRASIRRTRA